MHQFNASGRCVLCGMGQAAIRVTGEQYHCGRADPGVQRLNSEPDPPLSSVPMRYVVVYVPVERENEIRAIAARMVQASKDYPAPMSAADVVALVKQKAESIRIKQEEIDRALANSPPGDIAPWGLREWIKSDHDEVIEQAERYVADARRALLAECAQEAVDNLTPLGDFKKGVLTDNGVAWADAAARNRQKAEDAWDRSADRPHVVGE